MNVKKILSGALIGAFVFGVSASNIQPVSAASISDAKTTLDKYDKAKDKFDSAKDKYNGARDKFNRNNSDGNNPPEPPKDENGNPLPPPNENSDGKTTLDKAKDKYDSAKDKYDKFKDAKKIADKVK